MAVESPLVSVLMTSYNREQYIAEAIDSVLRSDFADFELIIADDRSTDKTIEIAESFSKKDGRVKIFVNGKNLGQFENRNHAVSYAQGKYIKYVDSDDKLYPFSLGYCVSAMEANPAAEWGILSFQKEDEGTLLSSSEALHRHFFVKPMLMIGPGGTIYKRNFFNRINRFSLKYGPANDVYTNLYAAANGSLVVMTRDFFYYRLHEGQALNNSFAYLYCNYLVTKDALLFLNNFFSSSQIKFIDRKSKRRFLKNITAFLFKTFDIRRTLMVWKKAGFTAKSAWQGLVH